MKYVLTSVAKANELNISTVGHYRKGDKIILNENEVMHSPHLDGDLDARVKALDARLYTPNYTKRIIKTENYVV